MRLVRLRHRAHCARTEVRRTPSNSSQIGRLSACHGRWERLGREGFTREPDGSALLEFSIKSSVVSSPSADSQAAPPLVECTRFVVIGILGVWSLRLLGIGLCGDDRVLACVE